MVNIPSENHLYKCPEGERLHPLGDWKANMIKHNADVLSTFKKDGKTKKMLIEVNPSTIMYDMKDYTADYVKQYMKLTGKNKEDAANDMKVSRNTLTNLFDPDKGISWSILITILSFLLGSDCPAPNNRIVKWYSQSSPDSLPGPPAASCENCDYYKTVQEFLSKALYIKTGSHTVY